MDTKNENNDNDKKIDLETIVAYVQLVHITLQKSATEINPITIRNEVKMFHKRFGEKEIKRIANLIENENKKKRK